MFQEWVVIARQPIPGGCVDVVDVLGDLVVDGDDGQD
jgi:hypothetical protein